MSMVEPVFPESLRRGQNPGGEASAEYRRKSRTPPFEIADLLATALLRLRSSGKAVSQTDISLEEGAVPLGFTGHQSVHHNPSEPFGERA